MRGTGLKKPGLAVSDAGGLDEQSENAQSRRIIARAELDVREDDAVTTQPARIAEILTRRSVVRGLGRLFHLVPAWGLTGLFSMLQRFGANQRSADALVRVSLKF